MLDQLGVELLVHALLGACVRGDLGGDGPLKLRDNRSVHSVAVPALVILLLYDAVKQARSIVRDDLIKAISDLRSTPTELVQQAVATRIHIELLAIMC